MLLRSESRSHQSFNRSNKSLSRAGKSNTRGKLIFSRAVALLFNWKYFWGWNLMQTTCGWHKSEILGEISLADDICHPHVICTSSRSMHVIRTGWQQLWIKPTGFLVVDVYLLVSWVLVIFKSVVAISYKRYSSFSVWILSNISVAVRLLWKNWTITIFNRKDFQVYQVCFWDSRFFSSLKYARTFNTKTTKCRASMESLISVYLAQMKLYDAHSFEIFFKSLNELHAKFTSEANPW